MSEIKSEIKTIFWDFDGVILNSQNIRAYGFRKIFEGFDSDSVERLIEYHFKNGGISRFHKIEYFFKEILGRDITQDRIEDYASEFSEIMKRELFNKKFIITDTLAFIKENYKNYNFYITSGAEHNELNLLCDKLELRQYFISIHGSPTLKEIILANLLKENAYKPSECVLIGDSYKDYKAASANGINFYGYNNESLKKVSKIYIDTFEGFKI